MKKIRSIKIIEIDEENPDTSWMGKYSIEAESEFAIDRVARGDAGPRQYQFFNGPVENYKGSTKDEIRKYIEQDYERMESLNAGEWNFIGIKAFAEIGTSENEKEWLINRVSSGGLWGIESDCGDEHKKEEAEGQLHELEKVLIELGFTQEEIDEAKKTMEVLK